MHVGVSGRRTPLAAPGRRTPDNLLGCIRDIGGRIDEGWILSAKFEEYRSQILCGRLHDDLANLDAAGEEDEVEGQLEKLRHLVFAAGDGSDGPRIEIFWNEIEQDLTGGGQTLGEFEDAWIASRNNLDSGVEEQRQWPIKGAYHQSDAVRLSIDLGGVSAFPKSLGNDYIHGLHPFFQFQLCESRGTYGGHDLEDFFLTGGFEVAAHQPQAPRRSHYTSSQGVSADRCATRKTWSRPNQNMLSACRRFSGTDSSESPSHIGLSMLLFGSAVIFMLL